MNTKFNTEIRFRSIGYVENEINEPVAPAKIRGAESRIILDPALVDGLKSVEAGSQIMVVFMFHQADGFDLQQHPRKDPKRPKRGVFALRSPRRPNPIGVTVVDVEKIEKNVLFVRGLDAINGSPVIDLKPA